MDTLKDFLKPEVIWFVVGMVLLIMEFAVPGLIIFFFGIGAWIVALICFLTDISLNAQLLIFISSSVLCLLCLRKWLKSIFIGHVKAKQNMKEDLSDFVGQKAVVIGKITPKLGGKVEFHGTNAVNLRIAEQYLNEFGKLAKTNNSIIIPSDLSDIAGMIKAAASVIKEQSEPDTAAA